jgi:hypothetical protein
MWTPPTRAPETQATYDAADHAFPPESRMFNVDAIIAAVRPMLPKLNVEPSDWEEPLRRYVDAVHEEAKLNGLGYQAVGATIASRIQARYAIAKALEDNPEIRKRRIDRPIFIIGGWRTGTTLLQRLMAAVPALRGMLPMELTQPVRFATATREEREALLVEARRSPNMLHKLNPHIMDIHLYGPEEEEECVLALGTDFKNLSFTSNVHIPSYAHWLLGQDMRDSYAIYGDILRMVQGSDESRRLVLKAPAHTASLPAIWANFPDAIVVQLHRDPVSTVTSGASLFSVFHTTYSDAVDPAVVGKYQLDMTRIWFNRAAKARDDNPDKPVIDVDFRDFVTDPIAMVANLCQQCEVYWDEAAEWTVGQRLSALDRQHASHKYSPEDFGLSADMILEAMTHS